FITVSVGMVLAIRCHRQNMKTSIINGSEVSRLSVAIQTPEGRKAMRLLDVPTAILVAALGLPPKHTRPDMYYSKGALCLMATAEGLTPMDFK
ncbi:hypothetical protein, partial [Klebsiella pneumoniae]|uniref:hypothetical protein n=1 Tax=Klebsiella pneumoniae TaxID=573 RepID=UPI003EF4D7DB